PRGPGVRVDRDQPHGVPATALTGPLGVEGGGGRDLLVEPEGGSRSSTAPGCSDGARRRQRTGRALHRPRTRRPERVDGPVRTRGPDGREGLVPRPDGPPLRRHGSSRVRGRRPPPGRQTDAGGGGVTGPPTELATASSPTSSRLIRRRRTSARPTTSHPTF